MNENIIATTHKHTFTMHILRYCVIENLKLKLLQTSAKNQCDDRNVHAWKFSPFYEEIENMFSECVCCALKPL